MGIICSKRSKENVSDGTIARLSPFGRFGRGSRSFKHNVVEGTLLEIAIETVCKTLHLQDTNTLRELPIDLAQLILDRLTQTGRLNDAAVLRLQGQQFYQLRLEEYPIPIRDFWVRFLVTGETLETVILSRTQIDDYVLGAFPYLPRLKILRLDCCEAITDAGLTLLARLPNLQELSLQGLDLLGPLSMGYIARLSHLKILNLNACHNIWGLGPLRRLSQLESLDLGWCNATSDEDAAAIASLSRTLKDLRLCHTAMGDNGIMQLTTLTCLTRLCLGGLRVSDHAVGRILSSSATSSASSSSSSPPMPFLRHLSLERCAHVGSSALQALKKSSPPLEHLDLSYTDINDEGLAGILPSLPTLRHLNLDSCSVGDAGLSMLSHLTSLEVLDLSDTSISNTSMNVVARVPTLTQLDLSFTDVNDFGLHRLSKATQLRALNLDSRSFTDGGMKYVARLPKLEVLDCFGAQITDIGCDYLAQSASASCLKSLEMCSGLITDVGVGKLVALKGLRHLSLAQNFRVGNGSMKHIVKMEGLTALNLSQCRVTSSGVLGSTSLSSLNNLKVLCLAGTRVHPAAAGKLMEMNEHLEITGLKMPDARV